MSLKELINVLARSYKEPETAPPCSLSRVDIVRLSTLIQAVETLRESQRVYMENRGNQELGMKVGQAAMEVDKILAIISDPQL